MKNKKLSRLGPWWGRAHAHPLLSMRRWFRRGEVAARKGSRAPYKDFAAIATVHPIIENYAWSDMRSCHF
jgi:hypothetical protein